MERLNSDKRSNGKLPIIEFKFEYASIYVYEGILSTFDIFIKYKQGKKRLRAPSHVHWAVDLLLKKQARKKLTNEFLKVLKNEWDLTSGLTQRDFNTISSLIDDAKLSSLSTFDSLDKYGDFKIEFLYVLLKLIMVQEKTNNPNAYMFGETIEAIQSKELDVYRVISKSKYRGR